MSLNSIKLENNDVVNLFKKSLVEISEKDPALSTIEKNRESVVDDWKYLGENKKRTLIIVRYVNAVHLPDKQLSFLTRLISACNLNLSDVAILNFHHYKPSDFQNILKHFAPKTVLLFDIKPAEFGMPMNFPDFQVQAYKDAVFVCSPSLDTIEPDKNLKGKLWACLKKIYNL